MDPVNVGLVGIIALIGLIALRLPIGFALGVVGVIGFAYLTGSFNTALNALTMEAYYTTANYSLSIVPLFILLGQFVAYTGLGEDAYYTAHKWLGIMPGGTAVATIVGCALFASVSGSSLATAGTLANVSLPEMKKLNYDDGFSSGCLAAGATLGIMIPPSVILIFYGVIAEQSVGQLFLAGFLPGILLTAMFVLYIMIYSLRHPEIMSLQKKVTFLARIQSLKRAWGIVVIFLVVMGGIYSGTFTPTEAGGIGAVVAIVFALYRRKFSWENLKSSLRETAKITAMIMVIYIGAKIFNSFMVLSDIPRIIANSAIGLNIHDYGILMIILLIYLVIGCFLDSFAMITITLPLFLPTVIVMGYDPIWFGIIMVIVSAMGLITPPLGLNAYVIAGVSNINLYTIFRGIIPFLIVMILFSFLLIVFPQIVMFLPELSQ